jgi:hypothetical protein
VDGSVPGGWGSRGFFDELNQNETHFDGDGWMLMGW